MLITFLMYPYSGHGLTVNIVLLLDRKENKTATLMWSGIEKGEVIAPLRNVMCICHWR